jgi:maltose O-acetyltransferase
VTTWPTISVERNVRSALVQRLVAEGRKEIASLDVRLSLGLFAMRLPPLLVGGRARALILRLAGVDIGPGSAIGGPISIAGVGRAEGLRIGTECFVNGHCHFYVTDRIEIGDRVALGQEVMILTGTHDTSDPTHRNGPIIARPVTVGSGAWLGARCVVLPGVTIGEGAVVAAGAVVTRDVPAHTIAAGVPAKVLRSLDKGGAADRSAARADSSD